MNWLEARRHLTRRLIVIVLVLVSFAGGYGLRPGTGVELARYTDRNRSCVPTTTTTHPSTTSTTNPPVTGGPVFGPAPAGWQVVGEDDFTHGLGQWGIYGDYNSTDGAGFWRKSNTRIGVGIDGKPEMQLVGSIQNGRFEGGAANWHGNNVNEAEFMGPGRWEWTSSFDAGNGYAGVMGMLWPNSDTGWPTKGEIDVIEFGGGGRTSADSYYHLDTKPNSNRQYNTQLPSIDYTKRHNYAVEWFPNDHITTWIDGVVVADSRNANDGQGGKSFVPKTNPMHLVFQEDWIGSNVNTGAKGPVVMHVASVRALRPA